MSSSVVKVNRIAFALERFSRFSGGAESYALDLADDLQRRGWEVHLYGQEWDGYPEIAVFHEIAVPRFLPSWAKMLLFALRHRQLVQQERFEVVVGFGNTISMNVYQSHGGVHRYSTARKCFSVRNPLLRAIKRLLILLSLKDKVRNWIESAPFRLTPRPRIIAISQMVIDDIASYYKVDTANIALIYNGIDLEKFHPDIRSLDRNGFRKKHAIPEDHVVFLFMSYTLRKKGIFPLIKAAVALKHSGRRRVTVLVVGKKPPASILRQVRRLGVEDVFRFHGPSKTPEVCLAGSDVLVLPTYYDTCSLVVLEAMACGLPAITTRGNGAAGIIQNGVDGHVIDNPPVPEELTEAMAVYLNPTVLRAMSVRAASKAKQYSTTANHEAVIRIFEEVAREGGKRTEVQPAQAAG